MKKNKKFIKIHSGFTLMELVATLVILSIIAAMGSKILQTSFNAYYQNQYIRDANTQGRLALERMRRDIHNIDSSSAIITATATQLSFTDINNNSVSYILSGTQLTRNSNVLANGVSSFSLSYLDKNAAATTVLANIRYVIINLVLTQGGVSYTLLTTAYTVNFT